MSAPAHVEREFYISLGGPAAKDFINLFNTHDAVASVFSPGITATELGFFGVTVQARVGAYTMTYATGSRTNSAPTSSSIATTSPTNSSPYGYTTSAQAAAIVTAINELAADVVNLKQVLTQVILDLQGYGLLQ